MKSRILWLSYGDENTHFFHVQTRVRRAWQIIVTLKTESDDWIHGQELHDYVTGHFQHLFQSRVSSSLSSTPDTLFSSSEFNPQELQDSFSNFQTRLKFGEDHAPSQGPRAGWVSCSFLSTQLGYYGVKYF